MPMLTIHPAAPCALVNKPCCLAISVSGKPGCAHPDLDWPLDHLMEMPSVCPCEPAPVQPGSPQAVARRIARRRSATRERWS